MSVSELIEDSVLKGYTSVDAICKNGYTYTLQKVYITDLINNTNTPLSILGRHIKGINTVLYAMGLNYKFDLVKSITVSNRLKNNYSIKDNKLILKSSIVANLEDSSNSEEYSDAFSNLISSIGAYIYTNMLKGVVKNRKDYLSSKYSILHSEAMFIEAFTYVYEYTLCRLETGDRSKLGEERLKYITDMFKKIC